MKVLNVHFSIYLCRKELDKFFFCFNRNFPKIWNFTNMKCTLKNKFFAWNKMIPGHNDVEVYKWLNL